MSLNRKHIFIQEFSHVEFLKYPIILYKYPPLFTILYEQFIYLAHERLQLFLAISSELWNDGQPFTKSWEQIQRSRIVSKSLKTYTTILKWETNDQQFFQAKKNDYIAHFILRLVCCNLKELSSWFIDMEMYWLYLRFQLLSPEQARDFVSTNRFPFEYDTSSEMYKVHFTDAQNLVKERKVILKNGIAQVLPSDIGKCVISRYRKQLEIQLRHFQCQWHAFNDDRVDKTVDCLSATFDNIKMHVLPGIVEEPIDVEQIDHIADTNFPLCMRALHNMLRLEHHLKHEERLQYTRFLIHLGLQYEAFIKLISDEFVKVMTEKAFSQKYEYNFRHLYGLVGRRQRKKCHNCDQIIDRSSSMNGKAGCPFRAASSEELQRLLVLTGRITCEDSNQIVQLAENGAYKSACKKFFESMHRTHAPSLTIMHPVQYFCESVRVTRTQEYEEPFWQSF